MWLCSSFIWFASVKEKKKGEFQRMSGIKDFIPSIPDLSFCGIICFVVVVVLIKVLTGIMLFEEAPDGSRCWRLVI